MLSIGVVKVHSRLLPFLMKTDKWLRSRSNMDKAERGAAVSKPGVKLENLSHSELLAKSNMKQKMLSSQEGFFPLTVIIRSKKATSLEWIPENMLTLSVPFMPADKTGPSLNRIRLCTLA